jgi:hypothetical protein
LPIGERFPFCATSRERWSSRTRRASRTATSSPITCCSRERRRW